MYAWDMQLVPHVVHSVYRQRKETFVLLVSVTKTAQFNKTEG